MIDEDYEIAMRRAAKGLAALLLALGVAGGCTPVDELGFRFENACHHEINLDMKYQNERDHEARVWNNTVVQRDQTIEKEVMVARLDAFFVTYWVWNDEFDYKSEPLFVLPPDGLDEISVTYLAQGDDGPCRFVEQAR
jgi:hypothetical protein